MCVRAFEKFFHVLKKVSNISFSTEVEKKKQYGERTDECNIPFLVDLLIVSR